MKTAAAFLATALALMLAPAAVQAGAVPAKLAYVTGLAGRHPVVHVANGDGRHAIVLGPGADALISPDGTHVAIVTPSTRKGASLVVRPSGGGAATTLIDTTDSLGPLTWSPDGAWLAVVLGGELVAFDIGALDGAPFGGSRLLAEFGGQDTSEAWTVDVRSGRARDLTGKVDSVIGRGLSPDGRTVLVQRGYFEDPQHQSVATIAWSGGHAHVLVRHGAEPSWGG